jgi:transcription elongation factor Elf1
MKNNPTDQAAPLRTEADVRVQGAAASGDGDDEIKVTDIVFDCPHCHHNLAIDYRGAGLQIECVECGEPVLVPIPEGMKIDDLDLSSGELLTQLFQTRRMMQKSEQHIAELEETLSSIKTRRTELEKSRMATLHRCAEMVNMCQTVSKFQNEITSTLNRMLTLIAEEQQR